MLTYASVFALPFTLTLYLGYIKGLDAKTIGLVIMVQALATSAASMLSGWVSRILPPRYMILLGLLAVTLGILTCTQLGADSSLQEVVARLILIGLGMGFLDPQLFTVAMSSAKNEFLGSASALLSGMRTLGSFLGFALISTLMTLQMPGLEIKEAEPRLILSVLLNF